MKKRLIVISCLLVAVMCLTAFAACVSSGMDDDTLNVELTKLKNDYNGKTVSGSLPGELSTTDAKGKETTIYIKWQVTDTTLVSISKRGDDGRCALVLSTTEAVTFTAKATLVDAKDKAYTNSDKVAYSVTLSLTANGTTSGGGSQGGTGTGGGTGGGGSQGGGSGTLTGDTVTFVMESQNFTDKGSVEGQSISSNGITIAFSKGSGKTNPAYYTNSGGNAVRLYGGNTMTISGKTIVKVVLTFAKEFADSNSNEITVNAGTFDTDTWTGSTDSLVFTIGGTSGHRKVMSIAVTFTA